MPSSSFRVEEQSRNGARLFWLAPVANFGLSNTPVKLTPRRACQERCSPARFITRVSVSRGRATSITYLGAISALTSLDFSRCSPSKASVHANAAAFTSAAQSPTPWRAAAAAAAAAADVRVAAWRHAVGGTQQVGSVHLPSTWRGCCCRWAARMGANGAIGSSQIGSSLR